VIRTGPHHGHVIEILAFRQLVLVKQYFFWNLGQLSAGSGALARPDWVRSPLLGALVVEERTVGHGDFRVVFLNTGQQLMI
jgi:hypothetical protein